MESLNTMLLGFPTQAYFYLHANCDPCNFRAIPHNSVQYENTCSHLLSHSWAQFRAMVFRLETLNVSYSVKPSHCLDLWSTKEEWEKISESREYLRYKVWRSGERGGPRIQQAATSLCKYSETHKTAWIKKTIFVYLKLS